MNKKEKYKIKRATTGLGLFATQAIPRNTRIIQYIGFPITNEEAHKSKSRYIMSLNRTHVLNGKNRTNAARYINHSCTPNSAAYTDGQEVWIWSKRAIKVGEEITMDYGQEYFNEYIRPIGCKCQKCAGLK